MACVKLMLYFSHLLFLLLLPLNLVSIHAQLNSNFYSSSCPSVFPIVKEGVRRAILSNTRVGASLLRLHFHDCFVNGCDGSVLLDDGPNITSEKTAIPNNKSLHGFDVVDQIKANVEKACPRVVSCADLLAIIARDSVVHYGGPTWEVRLGRRDSLTANRNAANQFLPPPSLSLDGLIQNFKQQDLSFKDMVVLSGAHTLGFARCINYRAHIYNDSNIDPTFAASLRMTCPRGAGTNDSVLQPLDVQTRFCFDNKYYQNLLVKKGLLHSDQQLYNGNTTSDSLVQKYASDQCQFFEDFAESMIKMGNIKPLTGNNGQIRLNCHRPN